MARTKYGIDMTRQSPEESKNLISRSNVNKTVYHPIVGKLLGMIYYVVQWRIYEGWCRRIPPLPENFYEFTIASKILLLVNFINRN